MKPCIQISAGRKRFLAACRREQLERPPVWVMRQAGRYLPEYRALREKHTFLDMVQTPELACEVTLQPLRRFALDAAIIFSDILVVPEALGIPYGLRDSGGIVMQSLIKSADDVRKLRTDSAVDHLRYVGEALKLVRLELGDRAALIGFGGSPWTLAAYMVEEDSSSTSRIKRLYCEDPTVFENLMDRLTHTLIAFFELQIDAGVDVIQVFDSCGGALSYDSFWNLSGQYLQRIVKAVQPRVPVIVYSKGSHHWLQELKTIGATVLGFDWTVSLAQMHDRLDGMTAVQGNLDPAVMTMHPDIVQRETIRILSEFGQRNGHIFNLGHGITPDARVESMETLVETVRGFDKNKR